jgi:hypothetical protein
LLDVTTDLDVVHKDHSDVPELQAFLQSKTPATPIEYCKIEVAKQTRRMTISGGALDEPVEIEVKIAARAPLCATGSQQFDCEVQVRTDFREVQVRTAAAPLWRCNAIKAVFNPVENASRLEKNAARLKQLQEASGTYTEIQTCRKEQKEEQSVQIGNLAYLRRRAHVDGGATVVIVEGGLFGPDTLDAESEYDKIVTLPHGEPRFQAREGGKGGGRHASGGKGQRNGGSGSGKGKVKGKGKGNGNGNGKHAKGKGKVSSGKGKHGGRR